MTTSTETQTDESFIQDETSSRDPLGLTSRQTDLEEEQPPSPTDFKGSNDDLLENLEQNIYVMAKHYKRRGGSSKSVQQRSSNCCCRCHLKVSNKNLDKL